MCESVKEGYYDSSWPRAVASQGDKPKYLPTHIAPEDRIWYPDQLTGLFGRRAFEHIWGTIVDKSNIAVVAADVNGVKVVNDTYGHQKGDKLIKRAAEKLRESLRTRNLDSDRQPDIVFREHGEGGDEFIILFFQVHSRKDVEVILSRLAKNCSGGADREGIIPTFSLGALFLYEHSTTTSLSDVLKITDQAMYTAKKQSKSQLLHNKLSLITRGRMKEALQTWQKPSAWEIA